MADPLRLVAARFTVQFDTEKLRNGNALIQKVTQNLKTLAGAAGIGIAARAVAGFTDRTTKMFDEISKGARTVGFSRQVFQEWMTTIELAGGSGRFFVKYVYFLQRGIGEAAKGMATYADAFRDIGLSPRELQKLSAQEQFEKVFNALGSMEDRTKRNAAAQRILGRGGRDLTVAMMEQLGQHEKNVKMMKLLSAVIKDEILIRSEKFRDRLVWLQKAAQGLAARGLERILDKAEPLVDWMTNVIGTFNKLADETYILDAAMWTLSAALAIVAYWVIAATWPFLLFVLAIVLITLVLDDLIAAFNGTNSVIGDFAEALTGKNLKQNLEDFKTWLTNLISPTGEWEHELRALKDMLSDLGDTLGGLFDEDTLRGIKFYIDKINELNDAITKLVMGPWNALFGGFGDNLGYAFNRIAEWTAPPGTGIPNRPLGDNRTNNNWNIQVEVASSGVPWRDGREAARAMQEEMLRQGAGQQGK